MSTGRLLLRGFTAISRQCKVNCVSRKLTLAPSSSRALFRALSSEEDFDNKHDRTMYRNDLHVIGKASSSPYAIRQANTGNIIGHGFSLEILDQDYEPVRCAVVAYQSASDGVSNYIAESVRSGLTLKIKGFFRKSVKEVSSEAGPSSYEVFYTIGPKSIEIVNSNDPSSC